MAGALPCPVSYTHLDVYKRQGLPGECGAFIVNPGTAREEKMKSGKVSNVPLKKGDILSALTPGSGGMGNPYERDVQMVLDDVLDERVSLEAAKNLYGCLLYTSRCV